MTTYSCDEVTTALAILLPEPHAMPVNAIRRLYDKAFKRWPAHINLAFPFVDQNNMINVESALTEKIAESKIQAFDIVLDSVGFFSQQGRVRTYHFKPNKESAKKIDALYAQLRSIGLDLKSEHIVPHLTIGQVKSDANELEVIARDFIEMNPIEFRVNSIYILHRSKTDNAIPFSVYCRLDLL